MRKKPRRIYRIEPPPAGSKPEAELPDDFLSLTIDTSFLLGGNWWGPSKGLSGGVSIDTTPPLNLADERLLAYARELSPAMLRIGGTEADHVRYKSGTRSALDLGLFQSDQEEFEAERILTLGKGAWKRIHRFLEKSGFSLLFTAAAGPAYRDENGAWLEANLARLAAYSVKKGLPVAAWELGNEVNAFPFVYGRTNRVSPGQYGRDFARFGNLLRPLSPKARLVGPATAVWPRIGEPNPIAARLAAGPAAGFLDAISWHYYPQQSSRGRVAVRRAGPETMLKPAYLDEIRRHCRKMNRIARRLDRCKPRHVRTENWLTETAHALYGGESGVSDTYASTLWWLDELGVAAQEGITRVFRQSLAGSDYGLLRTDTFEPAPDYFASLLWKRLMGKQVLIPKVFPPADPRLRIYLHRDAAGPSLLAINVDKENAATIMPGWIPTLRFLLAGSDGLLSKTMTVNGAPADDVLSFGLKHGPSRDVLDKYRPNELNESETAGFFEIPPLGILFLST